MKKTICLSFATTVLLLSTVAYAQSPNPLYQHLPPSASHVYCIRLGQIVAKGELLNLLNSMPPPKDSNQARLIEMIKDPASAGIDLDQILIAQTPASGTGADTITFTQILIRLTDTAKFRKAIAPAIRKMHIQLHRLPGGIMTMRDEKIGAAWNNHLLVVNTSSAKAGERAIQKSLAALTGFPANPLLTDQRFLAGFASDEDMHSWSTGMDFMSMMGKMIRKMAAKSPGMQGNPLPDMYSKMGKMPHPIVLSTFNFENGRIVFRFNAFYKPEDADLLHKVYDGSIDKNLLARVPPGLLLGFGAMHFNPAAIPDLMDRFGTRQMVDSLLGKKGVSIADITGIFGGDFMVAALGDTTATTDTTKKKVHVYFAATLGNPAALMNLTSKIMSNKDLASDSSMEKMKKLHEKMVIQDNILVVSGSHEMAQQYFAPHDPRSTDMLDSKNIQDVVIDLKAVSAFVTATMSGNPKVLVFAKILDKLDKVEINSSFTDTNTLGATFQIVTGDPSTNSLKTLVSLLH